MAKAKKTLLDTLKDSEASTSIIFGAIVVIVVGLLIFNFVRSNKQAQVSPAGSSTEQTSPKPNENGFTPPATLPTEHTVVKGENLWKIAEQYYGSGYNWVDIEKANNLTNKPLAAGMNITIPAVPARKATVAVTPQASQTPETSAEPVITAKPSTAPAPTGVTPSAESITGETYTVQKGDNLWSVAVRAYGDGYKWTQIHNANKDLIKNPDLIFVGWTLKLPR